MARMGYGLTCSGIHPPEPDRFLRGAASQAFRRVGRKIRSWSLPGRLQRLATGRPAITAPAPTTMPPPLNKTELVAALAAGARPHFIHFWGHQRRLDGVLSSSCLSQWWPARFEESGLTFGSAEHYMMYRKAELFGDRGACARILRAASPLVAMELGGRVTGFSEEAWASCRADIVCRGNYLKFSQNPGLAAYLLDTGDAVIVYSSPFDGLWGTGLGELERHAADPARWPGANLLGFELMRVRLVLGASLKAGA